MATATKRKKAAKQSAADVTDGLPPIPAGAVRVHIPGQPKADVEALGDGTYRVSYPTPQPLFWTDAGAPQPAEVEAHGATDAYNRAGGITGHDKPHEVETA